MSKFPALKPTTEKLLQVTQEANTHSQLETQTIVSMSAFLQFSYTLDTGHKLSIQRAFCVSPIYVLCLRGKDEDKRNADL